MKRSRSWPAISPRCAARRAPRSHRSSSIRSRRFPHPNDEAPMSAFPLLLLASLSGATGPATGDAARAMARTYVATYSVTYLARAHARIPAWARKYNMNCSGCHYPAPPRLNATGQRFKWAGYRMPEDFGDKVNVEKLQNYVAGHGVVQFEWTKTEGQPANNAF